MSRFIRSIRHTWDHTRKGRVAGALLVLFALANGIIYLAYRTQTYPQTTINGQLVGSVALDKLQERIDGMPLLPESIELLHEKTRTRLTPAELGMRVDAAQTAAQLADDRSWLPVANLLAGHEARLYVGVDPATFDKKMEAIGQPLRTKASDAVIVLRAGDFVLQPETPAASLDVSATQAAIVDALSNGRTEARIAIKQTPPAVTRDSLRARYDDLQARRNTAVTLAYAGRTRQFTPPEIGSWFAPADGSFALVPGKLADAVSDAGLELGANVSNAADIATGVRQAIEQKKPARLELAGRPLAKKGYSYCTAGRGVPAADVAGMSDIIDRTLNAKRGWSLGGNISFRLSADSSDCAFTIWLSAAEQMPSFGAICDPQWSCAVTPNVIFNYDRWRYTSDAWKRSGGSLEDYQAMVINHEVGHWLGFNHSNCPVAGQPAPVMQQQSIDLQGCTFNPWPSVTERTTLRDYLGL